MKRLVPLFAALLLVPAAVCAAAPLRITYTVTPQPAEDGNSRTSVAIRVEGLKGERSIRLQMAVWSPGDYHIMDHAQYVREVSASPDSSAKHSATGLPLTHPDPNTWQVLTEGRSALTVTYTLPSTPPGYFSENVRVESTYAFYNGPATYMYVVGHKGDPATVRVSLPSGWKNSYAPLPRAGSQPNAYSAPDFDTLADSPLVAGDFVTREFSAVGRPHTIVFCGKHEGTDYDHFEPTLRKIVEEENRLMGGPPYERYAFFLDIGGRGGGLEHLNSNRIAWGRGFRPESAASMFAHEFFHLWNVKRIRPEVLGPFDYVNPPKTRNLWFSEGVTDYYADMSVYRAGLMRSDGVLNADERLYRLWTSQISGYQNNPNRRKVTADESSLRVWEANNSSGYGGLSYYQKGKLIGLCLDLKLRAATNGRKSLDDVMRDMMARYGLPKPGFPEDGIRDAVIRAGGAAMGPFYDLLARSTEEMPFAECFAGIGLKLTGGSGMPYRLERDPSASAATASLRSGWLSGRQASL